MLNYFIVSCPRQLFTPTQHYKHINEMWRVLTIKTCGLSEVCVSLTCIIYSLKHIRFPLFMWKLHLIDGCMTAVSHANTKNGSCCF